MVYACILLPFFERSDAVDESWFSWLHVRRKSVAAAIAKRSIELLDEDKLIENSKVMGEYFKKSLIDMNSKIIKEVRGKGFGLELK